MYQNGYKLFAINRKALTEFKNIVKYLLPSGILIIIRRLRRVNREIISRKKIKKYLETHTVRKLHLGCGEYILKG